MKKIYQVTSKFNWKEFNNKCIWQDVQKNKVVERILCIPNTLWLWETWASCYIQVAAQSIN